LGIISTTTKANDFLVTMAEVVGITELQEMEAEVKLLRTKLEATKKAESTSVSCSRIATNVASEQAKDGFLVNEGSAPNQFHTSAGTSGESGCCVIS
jgi:uncharacterized protein (DUF3084 family)